MKPSQALVRCGSDKVMGFPYGHFYGHFYDELFSTMKEPLNILEIGVLRGESLRAWRAAFPESKVTGIDTVDINFPSDLKLNFIHDDVKNIRLIEKYDVIIDDSSHDLKESLYEIQNFLGNLTEKGVMVIEDIQIPELYISEMMKVLPAGFVMDTYDFRYLSDGKKHDDFIVKISRE